MGFSSSTGGGMANFYRLVCLLFVALFHVGAYASFPATSDGGMPPGVKAFGVGGTYYYTQSGFCDAIKNANGFLSSTSAGTGANMAAFCDVVRYEGAPSQTLQSGSYMYVCTAGSLAGASGTEPPTGQCAPNYSCPSGATLSGTSCTCGSDFNESGSACVPKPNACADNKGGVGYVKNGGMVPSYGKSFCEPSGCNVSVTGGWCAMQNGVKSCTAEVKNSGNSCTPPSGPESSSPASNAPSPPATEPNAPPGPCNGFSGTVNGAPYCAKPQPNTVTDQVSGSTKTTTPSTGGTSGTDSPGPVTTQEKNTSCEGGKCTTTTTTTIVTPGVNGGPATTSTSAEKTEEDKGSFCEQNPTLVICKTSSIGGGNCNAPDSCDGDAIQCAIAARSLRIQCALSPDADGSDADYLAAKQLTGKQTDNLPGNETVNVGPGSFDTSDALGGGSCIANRVVVVAGSSITIPFSDICVHLAMLGNLLLTVSFLLGARIVVRG